MWQLGEQRKLIETLQRNSIHLIVKKKKLRAGEYF